MRFSSTWLYYGLGLTCLVLSVWLVVSPPGRRDQLEASAEPIGPTGLNLPAETARPSADMGRMTHLGGNAEAGSEVGSEPRPNAPLASILPAPQLPPIKLVQRERQAWIGNYCEQLAEYSYRDDLESLEHLLAELGSVELEIAESAYHNLMVRHDRRAIPYLELRVAAAGSAFEKRHLQELVDFLETKSINESILIR